MMADTPSASEPEPNTPEGWTAEDSAYYAFLLRHEPPRPGSFLQQLKIDVRSAEVLRYWATGIALVGAGLAVYWIDPALGGVRLGLLGLGLALVGALRLGLYAKLLLVCVRMIRHGPVLQGTIRFLQPHSVSRKYSLTKARLADERSILVSVPTAPATALLQRDGQAKVLFIADPEERNSVVFGIRAVSKGGEEEGAKTDETRRV
jgi:hypothetical protein